MRLIDYKAVRGPNLLAVVLGLLNLPYPRKIGNTTRGHCPLRCCESGKCCSYSLDRNLWRCHHCRCGGNALDLFCLVRGLTLYDGAGELCRLLGREVPYIETSPFKASGHGGKPG